MLFFEANFFQSWSEWSEYLGDCDFEVEFFWITPRETPETIEVAKRVRELRSGGQLIHPSYNSVYVPLETVSKGIWRDYQKALNLRGQRNSTNNPSLGESKEPESDEQEREGQEREEQVREEQERSDGPSAAAGASGREAGASRGKGSRGRARGRRGKRV